MSQTALFAADRATPELGEWTEIKHLGQRIRWKHDGREHANPSSGFTLEYYHDQRREWRLVKNWSSRDWFCRGFMAAGGSV